MTAADTTIATVRKKLDVLLAPIDDGVGEDISADELFDEITSEVDKLQSLAGGKVDWAKVASSAADLLSRGKDFRVALYWTVARAQQSGIDGFFEGVVLLQGLCDAFWEPMYPPLRRPKARANLIGWVAEMILPTVQDFKPGEVHVSMVRGLAETLKTLDRFLAEKLMDAYPGFGDLGRFVAGLVELLPAEPSGDGDRGAAADGIDLPIETPVAGGAPAAMGTLPISDAATAYAALRHAQAVAARAASALRLADPGDPAAYRILRSGAWLVAGDGPPAEGNITSAPAPPELLRRPLQDHFKANAWQALLDASERALVAYPFWLDLNRYTTAALDGLGTLYEAARNAVMVEVRALLVRAPNLPWQCFSNGIGLADPLTREWLAKVIGGEDGGPAHGSRGVLERRRAEARTILAQGDRAGAIAVLTGSAHAAPSAEERFRAQLEAAKICVEAGSFRVARPIVERLDQLVEEHKLLQWDPRLCADLYIAAFRTYRGLNLKREELARKSLRRVSELAPEFAAMQQDGDLAED